MVSEPALRFSYSSLPVFLATRERCEDVLERKTNPANTGTGVTNFFDD
jgi:hypothetical protein